MIYGIGVDIVKVERFLKHIKTCDEGFFSYIFAKEEQAPQGQSELKKAEHYASRFAAKEAFAKALGTGLLFDTKDVFVYHNKTGRPCLFVRDKALLLCEKCIAKPYTLHLSLSHEKSYAIAQVIIQI